MSFLPQGNGPKIGGSLSALNLSVPTVIVSRIGQFWSVQVSQAGSAPGYFYDANALPLVPGATPVAGLIYPSPANQLAVVPGVTLPNQTPQILAQLPSPFSPFPFLNGLVFVPGVDGMVASVFYT